MSGTTTSALTAPTSGTAAAVSAAGTSSSTAAAPNALTQLSSNFTSF